MPPRANTNMRGTNTGTGTGTAANTTAKTRQRRQRQAQHYGDQRPIIPNGGEQITVTDQLLSRVADGVLMLPHDAWTPETLKNQIAGFMGIGLGK